MGQFASKEEYDRWKASKGSESGSAPAGLLTVARQKPRMGLVIFGVVIMVGASVFLYATGDVFSGTYVLLLGGGIAGLYWRFKMKPWLEDAELMKKSLGLVAKAALTRGVSPEDAEDLKRAEQRAKDRLST